jgi:transposase-like protein
MGTIMVMPRKQTDRPKRRYNRLDHGAVFALLDSGATQARVARIFDVAPQYIQLLARERRLSARSDARG